MGQYRQKKMEYFKGSASVMRLYRLWVTLLALFSIVTLTWKVTGAGYPEPVYFLLDFLVCAFSLIALLSFVGFDQYTVFGNIAFLAVFLAAKVYRALHYMGVFGSGGAAPTPDLPTVGGMGADMMGAMGGMDMMSGVMGGMDAMGGMVSAAPVSPDIGMLGQLVQKFLSGPLKVTGDFSKFIVVLECELFGVLCIFFMVFFLTNWRFFKTPLSQLRDRES